VAVFVAGTAALAMVFAASLSVGAVRISIGDVLRWVFGQLPEGDLAGRVLTGVRLPRSLGALLVGAALAATGATLQRVHRTTVVDGHLIGISAASGLGVAIGYAIAAPNVRIGTSVILGAATGALFAVVSRRFAQAGNGPLLVILIGIAAGFALTAWTGLLVLMIDNPAVPTLSFFLFGTLSGTTMTSVLVALPLMLVAVGTLWRIGPSLDLLSLGESEATHLGFNTQRGIPLALGAVGIAVGASVALGGIIGFVGLVVPFVILPIIGPSQRLLMPASALIGATTLLVFDIAARTLASPVEIPIGLLTAAIGGPVLVWLVQREMRQ